MEGSDVSVLLQALPYIQRHKGAVFLVKFGGEISREQQNLDFLALDIALCVNIGIKIVLVHGGGPQATELSRRLGVEPVIVDGRRVTDEATLEVAKMVFAGQVNIDILSALRRRKVKAVGLSGVDAGIINAVRRPILEVSDKATGEKRSIDFGLVGDIVSVETSLLDKLIADGYLPVITSLGGDDLGNVYNINADTVAANLAIAMKADKLIALTDTCGILGDPKDPSTLVSHISAKRCEEMIDEGIISKGMVPKVRAMIQAVRSGVRRAHILDGKKPHTLLVELFTKDGAGTMVTTSEEERRYIEE